MPIPKRVNLHVGYNKTGSSSIQAMLSESREILARAGIYYPQAGIHNHAHYALSSALVGYPSILPSGKTTLELLSHNLVEELRNATSPQELIFSSEYLCCATPSHISYIRSWFSKVFPGVPVRIIIYLRRHDEWFASLFNQAEKQFEGRSNLMYDPDINSYIAYALKSTFPSPHYLKVLDSWASSFGAESIVVRPFQRSKLLNGCVCDDFLSLFDGARPEVLKPRTNESLTEERLILAMLWNRVIGTSFPQKYFVDNVTKSKHAPMLPEIFLSSVRLTKLQKVNIIRLFDDEYREIKRKYASNIEGDLFEGI